MPEGLSPMEAEEHRKHLGHRATHSGGRQSRTVQISEAVVLALVTITAAWSGFAAAKWGTESRLQLAAASTARTQANRAEYTALSFGISTRPRSSCFRVSSSGRVKAFLLAGVCWAGLRRACGASPSGFAWRPDCGLR